MHATPAARGSANAARMDLKGMPEGNRPARGAARQAPVRLATQSKGEQGWVLEAQLLRGTIRAIRSNPYDPRSPSTEGPALRRRHLLTPLFVGSYIRRLYGCPPVVTTCTFCGRANDPASRFCVDCGK